MITHAFPALYKDSPVSFYGMQKKQIWLESQMFEIKAGYSSLNMSQDIAVLRAALL